MNLDEQVSRKQLRLLYLIKSDQRLTQLWNTYLDNLLGLLDNEESIREICSIRRRLVHPYKRKQPQGIRNESKHSNKKNPQLVPKIQNDDVAY